MDKKERMVRSVLPARVWFSVLFFAGLSSGCSSLDVLGDSESKSSTINPGNLTSYVSNQDSVHQGLLQLAGLQEQPATADEWKQFIMAGVQYSNQKCDIFLSDYQKGEAGIAARNLVHDLQRQYVEKISANQYTNRTAAFSVLQGYISLCLPGNIEAASGGTARVAQPGSATDGGVNLVPYVMVSQ
ncbi:hypothetical protein VSS37_00960 [Candidatus Thiothrix sp. Deng01]|uniref:Lipoprotein n=1 Tax=Candidatus Thiothrix phosphatis TaxID=3112415 RepID=A0ABU6CTY3_9GAMM|nr:hypothetical protein [Candidatus Thiothrix sp. Deng01]MEB4589537.1 hypothetical protein [Candidatus Thiothrix sp. Deng01]